MKHLFKSITGLFILLPFMFASCSEELMEANKGESPLELSVNTNDLTLDIFNANASALNFAWTPGTNKGTNAAITYRFQLALDGSDFEDGISYDLGKNAASMAYTHESLNIILLDSLHTQADSEVNLKARVIADVLADGVDTQTSETVVVKVKTYKPVSKNLYIIGSAAPNGWSADNAAKMNAVNGAPGGFTWQGRLNAGELKFITTLGQFIPSYNKGDGENKLVYRDADGQPDEKFIIPASGQYKITLNILTLAISIEVLEAPEFGELWFVGGFTGWSFAGMRNDMLDPFVFHYNAELNSSAAADEFKIAAAPNFDRTTIFFRPEVNGQGAGKDLNVVKWSEDENGNDHKWKIEPGVYKIKLNIRTMKIDIVKFTPYPMIYLVGEATPNGWDIGNAVAMDAVSGNPYKFTWTGHLKAGEMKFSCDKQGDWNGAWFLAVSGGKEPDGGDEPLLFSYPGSNPDNKWQIKSAGTYTIELDQLQEIVKFTKH